MRTINAVCGAVIIFCGLKLPSGLACSCNTGGDDHAPPLLYASRAYGSYSLKSARIFLNSPLSGTRPHTATFPFMTSAGVDMTP